MQFMPSADNGSLFLLFQLLQIFFLYLALTALPRTSRIVVNISFWSGHFHLVLDLTVS